MYLVHSLEPISIWNTLEEAKEHTQEHHSIYYLEYGKPPQLIQSNQNTEIDLEYYNRHHVKHTKEPKHIH